MQIGGQRQGLGAGVGKCQTVVAARNGDQTLGALLHHLLTRLGLAAMLQPCVAGAQRGVACKRHLCCGGEDAYAVVRTLGTPRCGGRQHKSGF